MSYALSQLQTTALPIGEIASRSGYLSSSRFTARFQQHYGCLPKNVRQNRLTYVSYRIRMVTVVAVFASLSNAVR
jgi:AraC-like DNA-binding protein